MNHLITSLTITVSTEKKYEERLVATRIVNIVKHFKGSDFLAAMNSQSSCQYIWVDNLMVRTEEALILAEILSENDTGLNESGQFFSRWCRNVHSNHRRAAGSKWGSKQIREKLSYVSSFSCSYIPHQREGSSRGAKGCVYLSPYRLWFKVIWVLKHPNIPHKYDLHFPFFSAACSSTALTQETDSEFGRLNLNAISIESSKTCRSFSPTLIFHRWRH